MSIRTIHENSKKNINGISSLESLLDNLKFLMSSIKLIKMNGGKK